jgi:hypothetical protein
MMDKLARYLNINEELLKLFDSSLENIAQLDAKIRDRIFYVFAQVPAAEERFLQYGIYSDDVETRRMAIRSASFTKKPSLSFLSALWKISQQTEEDEAIRIPALLAYGSCLSRVDASSIALEGLCF